MSAVDQLLQTGTLAALVAIAWSLSRIAHQFTRATQIARRFVELVERNRK